MSSHSRGGDVLSFLHLPLFFLFLTTGINSTPTVTGPSNPVIEGKSFFLNCTFNYPTVTNVSWFKDGLPFDVSFSFHAWNLTVSVTNATLHAGNYSCLVKRSGEQDEMSNSFPLTVYYIHGNISVCQVHENGATVRSTGPSAYTGLLEYTVGRGTRTTLTCCIPDASNPPITTVQWSYRGDPILNGDYLDDGRTLVFNNIHFNDNGPYHCAYEHVLKNGTSKNITLKIVDPVATPATPVDVETPLKIVCVKIGGDATLPCTVKGSVKSNGTSWIKSTNALTTSSKYTIGTDISLTVHNVTFSDEGIYKCQATGTTGPGDSDTVQLTTNCITSVTINPSSLSTGIGTTRQLTCNSTYSNIAPPTYYWTTPNNTRINERQITLTNIQFTDGGTYRCNADSPVSQSRSYDVHVNVEGRPNVRVKATPSKAKLYHVMTLQCITNVSMSTFTWYNGSKKLDTNNERYSISSDSFSSLLTIKNFTSQDVNMYHCHHEHPNHTPRNTSLNVLLTTELYLRNDLNSQSGYVEHGIVVSCSILGGVGNINITWYNGTTPLSSSLVGVVIEKRRDVSLLRISSLKLEHEGNYSCRATDEGSQEFVKKFTITVNIPGTFTNPPPTSIIRTEGEYLKIDCEASGKPKPEISFFPSPSNVHTTVYENGSIIFNNVLLSDAGSYVCYFINSGLPIQQMPFTVSVLPRQVTPSATPTTKDTILGLEQNAFIFFVLAAVGGLFIFLIILLVCTLVCYLKCRKRVRTSSNGLPKAILETTSFERKPSLRGSLRKDNSGILAQNKSDLSSLWTFTTTDNTTSLPMTAVSSSVAVSPGPPVPSPIPPPDGPTASLATELQLPGNVSNFPRQNLRLSGDIMGEGEFGPVFKGIARHIIEGEEETLVAVKVLMSREGESALWPSLMDFASQMKLSSPSVSRILGLCVECEPYYVIYQYLNRGDLKRFLIDSHPSPFEPPPLTQTDLLDIISQISEGMRYLYTQQIIHGDLATRNCLVGSDLSVKIADLGIGHDLYEHDYYDNGTQLLPIRWMAPELLRESETGPGPGFSLASDVWSFGVFCWEVFSYARHPYEELTDVQVLNLVPEGHLLNPPEEGMPPLLYSLLMDCWQSDSFSRPLFTEIVPAIRSIEVD